MNEQGLPPIPSRPMTGNEPFRPDSGPPPASLVDFWRWAYSDLIGNTERGVLAEFIVSIALGCRSEVRQSFLSVDLVTPAGVRVEVKSASYIQSWRQKGPSTIRFSIAPAQGWDPETGSSTAAARNSDVYVFALLHHRDQETLDPLDLTQWTFYVLPTKRLDERVGAQKTIGLSSLENLGPVAARFAALREAVSRSAG